MNTLKLYPVPIKVPNNTLENMQNIIEKKISKGCQPYMALRKSMLYFLYDSCLFL